MYVPATETPNCGSEMSSVARSICAVAEEFRLNEKQRMVYDIVTGKFMEQHVLKAASNGKPL